MYTKSKIRNIIINKAKTAKWAKLYAIMLEGYKAFGKNPVRCLYKKRKEIELWTAGYRMAEQENKLNQEPEILNFISFDPEIEKMLSFSPSPKREPKKRRSVTRGKLEKVILRECLAWLKTHKIFAWRNNVGKFYIEGGKMIGFGIRGLSDITGILSSGRFFAVEAKREIGGKQSGHQKLFQQRVEANNGIYILARSAKDLEVLLNE